MAEMRVDGGGSKSSSYKKSDDGVKVDEKKADGTGAPEKADTDKKPDKAPKKDVDVFRADRFDRPPRPQPYKAVTGDDAGGKSTPPRSSAPTRTAAQLRFEAMKDAKADKADRGPVSRPAAPPAPKTTPPPTNTRAAQVATDRNDARLLAEDMGGTQADKNAFVRTYMSTDGKARDNLVSLADKDKLLTKDSQGNTLVRNLSDLATSTPAPGAPYTRKEILADTLEHLADPSTINQGSKNTCGATTVQYVLAKDQPAEYARIVNGLTTGDGKVKLQNGSTMSRVADSLDRSDGTWTPGTPGGRDDVERVVQAAFQDYGPDPRGSYSNKTDKFSFPETGTVPIYSPDGMPAIDPGALANGAWEAVGGNQGIGEDKVARLYTDVLGKPAKVVGDWGPLLAPLSERTDTHTPFSNPFKGPSVASQVIDAVKAGKEVPVDLVISDPATPGSGLAGAPVAVDANGKPVSENLIDQRSMSYGDLMRSHQVLITGIDDKGVHYRNPWGFETVMTEAELRSRLTDAIIPQ